MHSDDRVLVLSLIDGKKPISSIGVIDPRLFTGENKLHIVKNPQVSLWNFKYEMGALPDPLKQSFTSFSAAKEHAARYFKTRNIEIKEVIE